MSIGLLDKSMYEAILASAEIFLLAFLIQIPVICFSNVSSMSNLTASNFSNSLIFMSHSFTLVLTTSLELTNKWHLSALSFNKLFLNHSGNAFDVFSKVAITPLISSAIKYGVLSSAQLAISTYTWNLRYRVIDLKTLLPKFLLPYFVLEKAKLYKRFPNSQFISD